MRRKLKSLYFPEGCLPTQHVDSVFSMDWAEYKTNSNKAKCTFGSIMNHGLPCKLFLTEGKGEERLFVSCTIELGVTTVIDHGYQAHHLFTQWQKNKYHITGPLVKWKPKKNDIVTS